MRDAPCKKLGVRQALARFADADRCALPGRQRALLEADVEAAYGHVDTRNYGTATMNASPSYGGLFPAAGVGMGEAEAHTPQPEAPAKTMREAASVNRLRGSAYGSINARAI